MAHQQRVPRGAVVVLTVGLASGCGGRASSDGENEASASAGTATSAAEDASAACPGLPYGDDRGEQCVEESRAPVSPCAYPIPDAPPPSSGVHYAGVRFVFDPTEGGPVEVPLLGANTDCNASENGGFYFAEFDAAGKPTRLVLCPCSCEFVAETAGVARQLYSCLGGWPPAN